MHAVRVGQRITSRGIFGTGRLAVALCLLSSLSPPQASARARVAPQIVHLPQGEAEVRLHPVTGAAAWIRLRTAPAEVWNLESSGGDPLPPAARFLRDTADLLGLEDPDLELEPVTLIRDAFGGLHLEYRQVHDGVPVFAGVLRVHFDGAGNLTGLNGVVLPGLDLETVPALGADRARDRALAAARKTPHFGAASPVGGRTPPTAEGEPGLIVYRKGLLQGVSGDDVLAWDVEVRKAGRPHERVLVDARSGAIVERLPLVKHALDREVYDGGTSPSELVWKEGDGLPFVGTNEDEINGLVDFSEDVYNLFAGMSGGTFLSWDGVGGTMKSLLENPGYCPNSPRWDDIFVDFCVGNVTDDLVGHEWAHAYTDSTHDLAVLWQPGFLAQAYSDVWGELVDQLNGVDVNVPDTARSDGTCSEFFPGPGGETSYRWLLGEDLTAFPGPGSIRDLWHPACGGDPGRVGDPVNTYHCLISDAQGGRNNSAIASHAFTLLVDGGTYNGVTVPAIGPVKAAHVYWRAQTVYQTPASDFLDHSYALEDSCADLVGTNLWQVQTASPTPVLSGEIISQADCAAVSTAIEATELREEPTHCGFGRILEGNPPPLCNGLGSVAAIDSTDWEAGLDGWTVGTRDRDPTATTPDWSLRSYLPDGRSGSAMFADNDPDRGDCNDAFESGVLYLESPPIDLPPAQPPRLAFDHWVATELVQDGGNLKISVAESAWTLVPMSAFEFNAYNLNVLQPTVPPLPEPPNPLAGEPGFNGADEGSWGGSWGRSLVDLFGLADPGDAIRLRFELGLSGCGGRVGWYVDDVLVHSCTAEHTCGNGLLDVSEQCDDGNTVSLDGCSETCQLETGFLCSDSAPPTGNLLADGGFEAGTPNPFWAESSTNFGTPICSDATCSLGAVVPSEGLWLAWFGGADVPETATLSQSVTIPERASATVSFELWVGACDSATDGLRALMDGQEVYASGSCSTTAGYVSTSAPVDAFADGGDHLLALEGTTVAVNGGESNFFVDEVSLVGGPRPSLCCEPIVTLTDSYSVTGTERERACTTLTVGGGYAVSGTGDLTLEAGRDVVLIDGFRVLGGGRLVAGTNPELPTP